MPITETLSILNLQKAYAWVKSNLAYLLIIATLFLFISKSLYNFPIGIMALIGLFRFIRSPKQFWQDPAVRIYILLFLCLWLPLLISFVDAVNPTRSARTVFPYLRFLFMGIYVIPELRSREMLDRLNTTILCIVAFWCVDAVIQFIFKVDLFGHPYNGSYITGIFYPEITIGHVTAVLSPLYFDSIMTHSKRHKWVWILLIPLFLVILLSTRRAAWIMLFISVVGYLFFLLKINHYDKILIKRLGIIGAGLLLMIGLVVTSDSALQKRLQTTSGLFSGNYELAEKATGQRFALWQTSINIFRVNWINGVGPRGYRYIYQQYSDPDNFWHERGQTHPHQLYLEVLAETGIIGFLGLLLCILLLYRFVKHHHLFMPLYPYLLAVVIAVFPLNTHMAFYGSYWSSIFWWLMLLVFINASCQLFQNSKTASSAS